MHATFSVNLKSAMMLIILISITTSSGVLIYSNISSAIQTSMDFAKRFSMEQAIEGQLAIEQLILDCERIIQTEALYLQEKDGAPDLLEGLSRFWSNYKSYTNHSHCKMSFFSDKDGNGIICREDGDIEMVTGTKNLGFKSTHKKNGTTRFIEDPRNKKWYRSAIKTQNLTFGNFHGSNENPRENSSRGLDVSMAVFRKDGNLELIGVISIEINMEGIRRHLSESMKRSTARSESMILEHLGSGEYNIIAHDSRDISSLASNLGKDKIITISDLNDPVLSEAAKKIPTNSDFSAELTSGSEQIKTFSGNYLVTFRTVLPGRPPNWAICLIVSTEELLAPLHKSTGLSVLITLALLCMAFICISWLSLKVVRPIEQLTKSAIQIEQFRFHEVTPVMRSGIKEVDQLSKATSSMNSVIQAVVSYIPEEIIKNHFALGEKCKIGGESIQASILFTDIRDFSSISEKCEPFKLVSQLNSYLEIVSGIISQTGGTVDKYIGDSVMSFWNAPSRNALHARDACLAALLAKTAILKASSRWESEGLPSFYTRFGIHTGPVIVGNIGSSVRLNYTIIGDAVNLASRLEGLNKLFGTSILISECTRSQAGDKFLTRPIDLIAVKGRTRPTMVSELMGFLCESTSEEIKLASLTKEANVAYHNRRFADALVLYQLILANWKHDLVAKIMAERATHLIASPPPPKWSGVFHMKEK